MDIRALARRQLADYDRHRPGMLFAEPSPEISIAQAYEIQMEVANLRQQRGERIAGYKIGCLSPLIQAQLGISQPVFGHLYATELHRSGARLDPHRFDRLAAEGEMAVRLDDGGAIGSRFLVIELHNYVFRRLPPAAAELIANNAIHAGVILPAGETNGEHLSGSRLSVWKNGELLGSAAVTPAQDLLDTVESLAKHLMSFGRKLSSGDLILAGSPLPLYPLQARDSIEVRGDPSGGLATAIVNRS